MSGYGAVYERRMCPIGLDEHRNFCSASCCDACVSDRMASMQLDIEIYESLRNCLETLRAIDATYIGSDYY